MTDQIAGAQYNQTPRTVASSRLEHWHELTTPGDEVGYVGANLASIGIAWDC